MDTCFSAGLYRGIESDVLGARKKYFTFAAGTDMTPPTLAPDPDAGPTTRGSRPVTRVKANGVLFAAARRDQSALEGKDGSFFTMALIREVMASSSGSMSDAFERGAARTRTATENRQTPELVGSRDLARTITFSR
jgi:hypothetical protein